MYLILIFELYLFQNECDGRVISSFVAHTMRVNCVKWVQNVDNRCQQQDFVSCSTDNSAILWEDITLPSGSYKTYEKLIGNFFLFLIEVEYYILIFYDICLEVR